MKAPFPYFGGKRKVAPEVWAALGVSRRARNTLTMRPAT